MAIWLALAAILLTATAAAATLAILRRRRARRGWRRWEQQRHSGALAWTLFRRRPRLPRLTDRRDP